MGAAVAISEIAEDIRFVGRYDDADFVDTTQDHPLEQIFAHRAGALDPVINAAAERQELFREGEWLEAGSSACRRHNTPHLLSLRGPHPTLPRKRGRVGWGRRFAPVPAQPSALPPGVR